jgi:hypothetical protein
MVSLPKCFVLSPYVWCPLICPLPSSINLIACSGSASACLFLLVPFDHTIWITPSFPREVVEEEEDMEAVKEDMGMVVNQAKQVVDTAILK